jgi:hypothetical protein
MSAVQDAPVMNAEPRRAVSKKDETNGPAEQMLAVLDVLWDEMQHRIGDDQGEAPAPPSEDEMIAALWQIHELVFAMAAELNNTYRLLEQVIEAQAQAERDRVRSILLGPDGKALG